MSTTTNHSDWTDPLVALASPAPQLAEVRVAAMLKQHYGLEGKLTALLGERDQNFRLDTADDVHYVIKISNVAEAAATIDFQIQALLHIEHSGCDVRTPRIRRTITGNFCAEVACGDVPMTARVVSWVPGNPASSVPMNATVASNLGEVLANLGIALRDFQHTGDRPVLLWDMQRASELRRLTQYVADPTLRQQVTSCLDDFEHFVKPELPNLRDQVIHGDLNDDNVLIAGDGQTVAGVIDFGDMVRAPLIVDAAIAASYLRVENENALRFIVPFIAGYDAITPLGDTEIELLYDLIRTRLAATITILRWRIAGCKPDDKYARASLKSEKTAEQFLAAMDRLPRKIFAAKIRRACGRK